jgi:PAS domain S-box-containing protein
MMDGITSIVKKDEISCIVTSNGAVVEVSHSFARMAEYLVKDFLGKDVTEVFEMLRIGPNINLEKIDIEAEYFLFTKLLEVRFVNIKVYEGSQLTVYIFSEISNSNLNVKIPLANALCSDGYYGIGIYSLPDMTLLKTNDKYISFKDEPYNKKENCVGRKISEFATGFRGSSYEDIWKNLIKTGEAVSIDEYKYEGLARGITYWKLSLVPIFEGNIAKYCVVMTTEITSEVLNRKQLEEQINIIKSQNERLKKQAGLLNLSSEAIFLWNLNGGIAYWNKGAEILYGYSKEEAVGAIGCDLLKTTLPSGRQDIEPMLLRDKHWWGEIYHTKKNGKQIIVESRMQLIIDENGQQIVLETNRDITERIEIQEKLRDQKEQLEAIIQNIDDAIFIFDENKKYYLTNKAAKEYFPKTELNTLGDAYDAAEYYDLDGNKISFGNMTISKVFRGEVVINEKLTLRNSKMTKHISVNGRPIYDSNGNIKFAVLCSRDITDLIIQNKIIEEQKKELEVVIENIEDAIFVYDMEGKLHTFNTAAKDYFPKENLNKYADGYSYTKFFHFDNENIEIPAEERPFALIKKGQIVRNYKAKMVQEDKIKYINISGTPVYSSDGRVQLSIVRSRDITEDVNKEHIIRQQQELILEAEREKSETLEVALEMKDEFLSIISHEFRTPLNVINTAIQAMNFVCKDELSDRTKEYIKMIKQNVFRQMRLVNNLLDITRTNSGHIKINKKNLDIVYLTKSITESVDTYATDKGVGVTFVSSVNKKIIGIDDEKYERILLNLISNAIKFSIKDKLVTVKLSSVKGKVRIEVIDNGIGIPENKIDLIFERFGQVDSSLSRYAEGAGIGLSLVKKIVDALGGSISVKSTEGKGSTFTIMLPNEKVTEDCTDKPMVELLGNRLIEVTNVEFSDIYL